VKLPCGVPHGFRNAPNAPARKLVALAPGFRTLRIMSNPFRYFNNSPEVIRLVVMMYVRYPLSLWNVEDLLAERGIEFNQAAQPMPRGASRLRHTGRAAEFDWTVPRDHSAAF
jgi:hypothetical protein